MSIAQSATTQLDRRLRIFLCHSSGDKPAVRNLYQRLKQDGAAPWLDEEELVPGEEWREAVVAAVRACHVVVVCLSQTSITNEGFVQREIKVALEVAEEKPEGTIFLIPARLDGVEIPGRLAKWQWVDLSQERGYEKLVYALNRRAASLGLDMLVVSVAGRPFRVLTGHLSKVDGLTMTSDGRYAVSGSMDETLKLWDLKGGQELKTFRNNSGTVCDVAVSADGRRVVCASRGGPPKVWDLENGQVLRTLEGHSDDVGAVAISADGERAVSASWDGTLKLWDLESGRILRTIDDGSYFHGVAASSDLRYAATCDFGILKWPTSAV